MAIGADMDGDGLNDVVTAQPSGNGGDIAVSLNKGDGTFAPHVEIDSGQSHSEVAASDLDGDGDVDLATVNSDSSASVFINDGSGTAYGIDVLAGTQTGGAAIAVAVGDIDAHGLPDVAVANRIGNDISVWFNNGDGTFDRNAIHYGVNTGLSDLELADFDGDGLLDVAVPNTTATGFSTAFDEAAVVAAAPNGVSVVLNDGTGTPPVPTCTIRGTAGADKITGTAGDDVICGGAGNDSIVGGAGNDVILAGPGSDRVRGDRGMDRIFGGDGADGLLGGTGADQLNGGPGNDSCGGGAGTDTSSSCERVVGVP